MAVGLNRSRFNATGVRCGHISDSWPSKLGVSFHASQIQTPLLLPQGLRQFA
jgi:hypothetical protein